MTLVVCAVLVSLASFHFIVRSLTDRRAPANRAALELAASFFPASPRLNARIGQAELAVTEDHTEAARRADVYIARAIAHSPFEYRYHLLQATIRESLGDRAAAESALRTAVSLAPGYTDVRWRLANLLVRNGKPDEARNEFRTITSAQPALLPNALALRWQLSGGRTEALSDITGPDVFSQLTLAQFLLARAQTEAALTIFRRTDQKARLASDAETTLSAAFINDLLQAGRVEDAWSCWQETAAPGCAGRLCDGGFEAEFPSVFAQFAWQIGRSEYARIIVSDDATQVRSGQHVLRIDFTGRDTTRLDREVRHPLVLLPGTSYRLTGYVRTHNLSTPAGPRLAIVTQTGTVAETAPIASGTNDWQPLELTFIVPAGQPGLELIIRRVPQFAWDEPTRGTIWLDDFQLEEIAKGR